MLERLFVVLGQVTTLFLMVGVGFVLGKKKIITVVGTQQMSALLINVVTPCLIINAFPSEWDMESLRLLGTAILATVGIYAAYMLIAAPLFRKEQLDQCGPLRFGSIYGNVGFMGLPLIEAVLGPEALIYATIVIMVFNISVFTHGAVVLGGKSALSLKQAFLNPGVLGAAIGLPLFLAQIALPRPVQSALGYLSNLNTPLAMVVIGAQMSRASIAQVFGETKLYFAAAFKLLLLPAVTVLLLTPFKLERTLYITMIVLSAAPTAGVTSMLSERYGRNTAQAAQLVTLSTLLSILTLPFMTVLAELLAG